MTDDSDLIAAARAEANQARARICAMLAGVEISRAAAEAGGQAVCPFREDELHLVRGFHDGVLMWGNHRGRFPAVKCRGSFAAYSAPREE